MTITYSVRVKPEFQAKECEGDDIWVMCKKELFYVPFNKRGVWNTREEAKLHILEDWEEVVEIEEGSSGGDLCYYVVMEDPYSLSISYKVNITQQEEDTCLYQLSSLDFVEPQPKVELHDNGEGLLAKIDSKDLSFSYIEARYLLGLLLTQFKQEENSVACFKVGI